MKRTLAILVLFTTLPSGAHAGTTTAATMRAPYASDSHRTLCQWIASQTGIGTCTGSSAANRSTGALAVNATMASPDSPAGPNTLPAWGQSVAYADVLAGYHLKSKNTSTIRFQFTIHITRLTAVVRGLPNLAWVDPVILLQGRGVDCQCGQASATVKLTAQDVEKDVVQSIDLIAPGPAFGPGTFVVQAALQATSGLTNSFGLTKTVISGVLSKVAVTLIES